MCGIFGILDWAGPVDLALAQRASQVLRHRGPDDEGYLLADWRSGSVVSCGGAATDVGLSLPPLQTVINAQCGLILGHRRLSILDPSPAGHQPMAACNGRLWVTFNGEIYNYLELRAELTQLGYPFLTGTDTEVILAAYDAWGSDAVQRFIGMFAFAILDLGAKTLFLARDFFGIKPLYYSTTRGGLAFASEIPPLLELPGVGRRANARRVYDYLRFGVTDHGAETMFADVHQLPAAHHLTIDLTTSGIIPSPTRFWELAIGDTARVERAEAAERLRHLLLENIRLHLRSDVPVGACLSGGIDSSAIVAGMRRVGGPDLDLHAVSYVASDPALNEEPWADLAGTTVSAVMHKVHASPEDLVGDIDQLIDRQGEPFGSTSIYAQDRVFRLARANGMKVMLDGQGADELFLGYPSFFNLRAAALLQNWHVAGALQFARRASRYGPSLGSILVHAGGRLTPDFLVPPMMRLIGQPANPKWLSRRWLRRMGLSDVAPGWPRGRDMLRHEAKRAVVETSLPALLRYEDRNSMTYSIESRVPFLTPELASFVSRLPDEYLLSPEAISKAILRDSLRGLVPDGILARRDKVGFATPEAGWLGAVQPQIRSVLCSTQLDRIAALDAAFVRSVVAQPLSRSRLPTRHLWSWYNLTRWAHHFDVEFTD